MVLGLMIGLGVFGLRKSRERLGEIASQTPGKREEDVEQEQDS
jgi:hypothetical protein